MSYFFPQCYNWAVLLDYNCDGIEDLFCSTSAGIKVYKNESTPSNTPRFSLVKSLLYSDYDTSASISPVNLYASPVGVPGIADIDNDGDLDILTFAPQGYSMEYHKNISKEKYNNCDSLNFELHEYCWGKITESSCVVSFNSCGFRPAKGDSADIAAWQKTYHAGSCLTCIDGDGDGDKDIIMGDVSCNDVQYIQNTGSIAVAALTDTTKLYPNYYNRNNTSKIRFNNFPCTYHVDVDGDGRKDLVATPNSSNSEDYKSMWYYKDASLTSTVNFQFIKNNFLQDEMIEVGENSFPVVFDYNADGKLDLLVGNYGYYTNNTLNSRLTLYANTSSVVTKPTYSLITRDYASLSSQTVSIHNAMPTVGDIDNDGDVDICIGTSSGQIHWLKNTAGAGNPCSFVFMANPFTFTTNSAAAAPQLFDIDNDGYLDLLIGTKNGRIAYYKNTHLGGLPTFSLITNFLGNVDVKGNQNIFGLDGFAVPYFYWENTTTIKLLVGSVAGNIFHYAVPPIITNAFSLINTSVNALNEGTQSSVCYEDVNGDGRRDLIIGNSSGGLSFFSSSSRYVGLQEITQDELLSQISLFPNPNDGLLNVHIDKIDFEKGIISFYDMLGKEIKKEELNSNSEILNISELNGGIYFLKISFVSDSQAQSVTKKIIKVN